MRRRAFLAAVSSSAVGLSGCAAISPPAGESSSSPETTIATPQSDGTAEASSGLASEGFPPTICSEEIDEEFTIRAIVDPAFAPDWSEIDVDSKYTGGDDGSDRTGGLADEMTVVGLEADDRARAYPVSVLWHHEIVNDQFGGPLMVTFCPICNSGMVAERIVDGEETTFGVSGLLWQPPAINAAAAEQNEGVFGATVDNPDAEVRNSGNLVLYDQATRSLWSQLLATALCGPLEGTDLTLIPSTLTTWGEWRSDHPETDVLLAPPESTVM